MISINEFFLYWAYIKWYYIDACMQTKSLLQLYKQCIFMTGFGNRVSHKIWQLKCIKIWQSGKTACDLWFYVPKTNFWSHKGYVSCRNDRRNYGNFKKMLQVGQSIRAVFILNGSIPLIQKHVFLYSNEILSLKYNSLGKII